MSRRQRAALGVFLTCLLGWAAEFLLICLSIRFDALTNDAETNGWLLALLLLAWLGFFPACGFTMGVTHAYLYPASAFDETERRDQGIACKWVFWVPHALLFIYVYCAPCTLLMLVMFNYLFDQGQTIGSRWVETRALDRLSGRRNEWEFDDSKRDEEKHRDEKS